jgi:MFS transporter, FSR family, fosmidomycin resistance protein
MANCRTRSFILINRLGVLPTISLAHGLSHFFHLLLAPLFPLIKVEFGLSYAELGLLMSIFFAVSGVGQALGGFLVDKVGPVPVLLASLVSMILATLVLSTAPNYVFLIIGSVLAGLGNASFHPVDYSILNARIKTEKLGSAYAVHGISGNLGWAIAPVFLLSIASVSSWRVAVACAGGLAAAILVLIWTKRKILSPERFAAKPLGVHSSSATPSALIESPFAFLGLPAVWMSFAFFFAYAVSLGGVQSFGAEAASKLHAIDATWIAFCLSSYMVASAGGTLVGGRLVSDPSRAEQAIGIGFSGAAVVALLIGFAPISGIVVPLLFGLLVFFAGIAGPSLDLLVKRAAPVGATGRVYGVVYSGLDAGMAVSPLVFGLLMDAKQPLAVWIGIAVFQALLIVSALGIGRFATKTSALAGLKA